jgi:thiol:disulfide interchange protein
MKKILTLLAAALIMPAFASDFPAGSPQFGTSYETALATAKKEGKPIILVFSATWCPPCQSMKKSVYPSAEVKPLHDKFVWAYLDVDDAANAKVAEKFGVNGIPHIQFLNSGGKDVDKVVGGVPSAEFAATLTSVLKKAK